MDPLTIVKDEVECLSQVQTDSEPPIDLSYENEYSALVQRWIKCEYFYSYIDRGFFAENHLHQFISPEARMTLEE